MPWHPGREPCRARIGSGRLGHRPGAQEVRSLGPGQCDEVVDHAPSSAQFVVQQGQGPGTLVGIVAQGVEMALDHRDRCPQRITGLGIVAGGQELDFADLLRR